MRLEVSPAALTGTGEQVRYRGTELGNASHAAIQTLTGSAGASGEAMVAAGLDVVSAAWGTTLTLRGMAAEALGAQAARAAQAYVTTDTRAMLAGTDG